MAKIPSTADLKIANVGQLYEGIRAQAHAKLKKTYAQVQASLQQIVQGMVRTEILASNTTRSLLGGKLQSDFGLESSQASSAVNKIIDYIANNIELNLKYSYKGKDIALFTLDLLPLGIDALTELPQGSYRSSGKYGGGDVTWLTWLLTKGTTVVIGDFWVFPNPEGSTRSGSVMQKVSRNNPDGFRVDPAFAGVADNNFVTRALSPIIPKIQDKIFKEILEGFK